MRGKERLQNKLEFHRSLSDILPLINILLSDTVQAFREYNGVGQSRVEDKPFQIAFWNRVAVRCLFALIEGATSLMRHTAAAPRNAQRNGINNKVRAKLLERKYDRAADRVDDSWLQPNGVADNVKLAFRHYPRVFDSEFSLDTNSPEWIVLVKDMIPARNQMIHAGRPEDFFCVQAIQALVPVYSWFATSLLEMLYDCAEKVEVRLPAIDEDLIKICNDSQQPPKVTVASDNDFYKKVGSHPIAALRFLSLTRDLLFKELHEAHTLIPKLVPENIGSQASQFAIRNYFRTLINNIEATADVFKLYLQQAKARGGLNLSSKEERQLNYKDPLDRLVSTYNIFSSKVGTGSKIEEVAAHRKAMERALGLRNRLTHPGNAQDLCFEELPTHRLILGAMHWLSTSLVATKVDLMKFLDDGLNSGTVHL